jgi:hypothetical protein
VGDPRLPADRVDLEHNAMRPPARLDHGRAVRAVEREAHRDDGFQRIALSAARRRNVGLAARDADGVVEHFLYRLGRDAAAVVGDHDLARRGRDLNADLGRDAGLFSLVERIVDALFQDDERPALLALAGLRNELLLTTELG